MEVVVFVFRVSIDFMFLCL